MKQELEAYGFQKLQIFKSKSPLTQILAEHSLPVNLDNLKPSKYLQKLVAPVKGIKMPESIL